MTTDFPSFARLVAATFQRLAKSSAVFTAGVTGDDLYEVFLAAFPEGTNPLFKKRTEHDCGCCKSFIRRVANVVTVADDGHVFTVWDDAAKTAQAPYNTVAAALREKVLASPIDNLFRVSTKESSFGAQTSRSQDAVTKQVYTWDHFYTGQIPAELRVASPGEVCGTFRTTVEVFERGLIELSPEALDTVSSLIAGNNLYRGEEHGPAVNKFRRAQKAYLKLGAVERRTFAWAHAGDPAARFRNTVIGTLVQDLSEGTDLEAAVRSFESKVAPQNYKRTTALITPLMVKKAMETLQELDLEPALERRFATLKDISVNDVLWVDGAAKPLVYSQWGQAKLAEQGVAATYVPIGIDPQTFRVLEPGMVGRFRAALFGADCTHLTVMVAANVSYPDRKAFQVQLRAWALFAEDKPGARLYIHTDPTTQHEGVDLYALAASLNIADKVIFPDRYQYFIGYPPEYLALVYNAADVLLAASMAEGFGIPLVEAQACGCPVIATNFSSMSELTKLGKATEPLDYIWTPLGSWQAWPDANDIANQIELYSGLVRGMEMRTQISKQIHEEFGWDAVVERHWAPLFEGA